MTETSKLLLLNSKHINDKSSNLFGSSMCKDDHVWKDAMSCTRSCMFDVLCSAHFVG